MAIYRFESNNTATYVREPGDAVYTNLAVELTQKFSFWPEIVIPLLGAPEPKWVWQTNPVTPVGASIGQVRYFGRAATFTGIPAVGFPFNLPVLVSILADNAFRARLRVQTFILGVLTNTTLIDIPDGVLDPAQGFIEVEPPYRWQVVTNLFVEALIPVGITEMRVDLEIEAVNYAQTDGTPNTNPAGVQFLLQASDILPVFTPVVTEVVPEPLF